MSQFTKANCKNCGNYYEGRGKLFCSNKCCKQDKSYQVARSKSLLGKPSWNKGVHIKANDALKEWRQNGGTPWNKDLRGIHLSMGTEFRSENVRGERNVNWKGGVTPINEAIRKSAEYKQWRMSVFQRDGFTCIGCGYRSRGADIRADHIKPFCNFPELRFDLNNGRTLCVPCDKKMGWNSLREEKEKYNYHNIFA